MDRRRFIRSSIAAGLMQTAGGLLVPSMNAAAASFPPLNHRVLVNTMLFGGPDFRYLMPPAFDPDTGSFSYRYWESQADVHQIGNTTADYLQRWNSSYTPVNDGGTQFGILNSCGWLKSMWDAGNVAIVCNSVGGTSRSHPHCELIMDQGDLTIGPNDIGRSGWGGRLAAASGGNVLALTSAPREFCYGPHPLDPTSHDNANLISIRDTRAISLYHVAASQNVKSMTAVTSRSLASYYAAKRAEMNPASVYRRFVEHEATLRNFGGLIDARLMLEPMPGNLTGLTSGTLNDPYLGQQIQNLYDAFLCSDIMNMHVASLEFGSFDSHKNQQLMIEPMFADLFGDDMAFDTLFQNLPAAVADNVVLVMAGEFGRQIRGNRDGGNDHGSGNSILLIGKGVRGGVFGNMFPDEEMTRLEERSPDIAGLTSFEHVFGAACDWVMPGSGDFVFPARAAATLETGVSPGELFV